MSDIDNIHYEEAMLRDILDNIIRRYGMREHAHKMANYMKLQLDVFMTEWMEERR